MSHQDRLADRFQLLQTLAKAVADADKDGAELPFGVLLALHDLRKHDRKPVGAAR